MNFTAIDFETANEKRSSACSVGIAVVENSEIIHTEHHLIKPEPFYFNGMNISIHGIHESDVEDADTFDVVWQKISPRIQGPLVAHNASFDMSVLRKSLDSYDAAWPDIDYACTLIIAKNIWNDAGSHKLDDLADFFNLELEHHNAESDAIICAKLAILAGQRYATKSFEECDLFLGSLKKSGEYVPCKSKRKYKNAKPKKATKRNPSIITCPACAIALEMSEDLEKIPTDMPLECTCGHVFFLNDKPLPENKKSLSFCFSGKLDAFTRKEARAKVVAIGAKWLDSPNYSCDYMVLGNDAWSEYRKSNKKSGKISKAESLIEQGSPIEIISEETFLQIIH